MAFAFDTLGFANHLKKAGVDAKQAEAHAEAAREFIMTELVTKGDLAAFTQIVDGKIERAVMSVTLRVGGIVGVIVAIAVAFLRLTGTEVAAP